LQNSSIIFWHQRAGERKLEQVCGQEAVPVNGFQVAQEVNVIIRKILLPHEEVQPATTQTHQSRQVKLEV